MEGIKRPLDEPIPVYNNNKKQTLLNEIAIINPRKSCFENLANETVYEIFEYLDAYHVYHGFFNLKQRFKNLVRNSNFPIQIKVSTISKLSFEHYHKNMIIPNQHRINILHLSNPFTVDIIFSSPRLICNFIQLERLTLENINTNYLHNILKHLVFLPKFDSLILSPIDYIADPNILFLHIFCLPKLRSCQITYRTKELLPIYFNQYQSSSIEYLVIDSCFQYESLISLLMCLPKLRHLSVDYLIGSDHSYIGLRSIVLKDLKYVSLKLQSIRFHQFEELIKKFFNYIEILEMSMSDDQSYLHAQQWEKLISSFMPNLRTFDMKNEDSIESPGFSYHSSIVRFNFSFWNGKQWFFGHQYDSNDKLNNGIFYSTNPYRRKDFKFYWQFDQHTCWRFQENDFNSVKHVHICGRYGINKYGNYFPNATQLTIEHHFQTPDDSISTTLNRIVPLKQLNKLVIQYLLFPFEQLVKLISFTPNLHTLELNSLSMHQTNSIFIQQSETFRYVSNTNKTQNLIYHSSCSAGIMQLIGKLLPRIEYLKTGIFRKEIVQIIRYFLSKMNHLSFLCITQIPEICLRKLNILIQSENLLDDYFIKLIDRDLYLWW